MVFRFSRHFWIKFLVGAALLAAPFSFAGPAAAAGLCYVNDDAAGTNTGASWTNAYNSLQSALSDPCTEIWVAEGLYKPTSGTTRTISFVLENGTSVYGGFAGTETLLSQRDPVTHVTILSGEIGAAGTSDNSLHVVIGSGTNSTAVLDGFTIRDGNANESTDPNRTGGGMFNLGGSPTLTGLIFTNNNASYYGGGIYNENGSSPALTQVAFSYNSAAYGAGLFNYLNSSPTLTDVSFNNNAASADGGGMYSIGGNQTVTDVTFTDNTATFNGAGMYNLNTTNPVLTNVTFTGNHAGARGGGMYNYTASLSLDTVTFDTNLSDNEGGGMFNGNSSNPSLENVTFTGNLAVNGAGMFNDGGSFPALDGVDFTNNDASGGAGGMYNFGSNPDLNDVTFSGNEANTGAGMINEGGSAPVLEDVTFSGNTAAANAGGMGNYASSPTLTGVTFSDNEAIGGAGMYNVNGSSPSLTNVTFSGNQAANGGGGMMNEGSDPALTNVTFSGNTGALLGGGIFNYNSDPALDDVILWGNGDEVSNSGTSAPAITRSVVQGGCPAGSSCTNVVNADPLLGPLQDNGGLTETMAPGAGGSAVDTGGGAPCAVGTDQRGIARPQGAACDIGAVEIQDPAIHVSIAGANQDDYLLPATTTVSDSYPSMLDGPVSIASVNPDPFLTSQRVTSGASYNELMGVPPSQFTTEYWFPFYDHGFPSVGGSSMRTWILVGNPDEALSANVDIYIGGTLMNSYVIPPGDNITPRWIGLQDGPVRVVSDIPVFTSERVFTVPNNSFNEVMGYPADQFTTEYWFPWYDSVSMNASILVGNTSASLTADVDIYIGPNFMGNYDILPDETLIQSYPATVNGPVRVVATNGVDIVASEAALSGPTGSFTAYNEVMGYPFDQFATEYHFPWYDHGYPSVGGSNMRTWILVGNPDDTLTADVDIFIDGALQGSYSVPPNSRITPRWIGLQGGPVRVVSDIPVFTSERVFTSPSNVFNEMMGYPGSQLTIEYWFAWYDSVNMTNDILIARP